MNFDEEMNEIEKLEALDKIKKLQKLDKIERSLMDHVIRLIRNIGVISSIILICAYIAFIVIYIVGIRKGLDVTTALIYSGVNAAVGFGVSISLMYQGLIWAQDLPDNKKILERYNNLNQSNMKKPKKYHGINYYWATRIPRMIFTKGLAIVASTFGVVYICIQGSKDPAYILLGIMHILLFASFGLLGCAGAYNFYNNNAIQKYLQEINEAEDASNNNIKESENDA